MPSLKDLKNRIGSVKSTQKITSAMKMVAAAKLRKAQEQALASRPYTSLMDSVVSKISSKAIGSSIDLLSGKEEIKTHLLVVFSADRGLCGGFNGSITRTVRSEIKKLKEDGINVKLLMVGKNLLMHSTENMVICLLKK
jgi:F-type H+-transporting ATPase subunit gamma